MDQMRISLSPCSTSLVSELCKDGHRPTNVTDHRDPPFDPITTNQCGALHSALCCPAIRTALAGTFPLRKVPSRERRVACRRSRCGRRALNPFAEGDTCALNGDGSVLGPVDVDADKSVEGGNPSRRVRMVIVDLERSHAEADSADRWFRKKGHIQGIYGDDSFARAAVLLGFYGDKASGKWNVTGGTGGTSRDWRPSILAGASHP
ncbi:hypothetical protein BJY52DRAFT_1419171 [Lactarius psammicola]|nr:hypothetical protein BJY52DRAFT_1419171 [Lactarius psammicola]